MRRTSNCVLPSTLVLTQSWWYAQQQELCLLFGSQSLHREQKPPADLTGCGNIVVERLGLCALMNASSCYRSCQLSQLCHIAGDHRTPAIVALTTHFTI